jgi:hypothetical protein
MKKLNFNCWVARNLFGEHTTTLFKNKPQRNCYSDGSIIFEGVTVGLIRKINLKPGEFLKINITIQKVKK